jgi:hypothetical protein
MKKISIFKNFNDLVKNITLSEVLEQIKSEPKLKTRIETLRKQLAEGNKTAYDQAKKSLLAFTPSGTFANGRKADLLETYTQYIILDIDKLSQETLQNIKQTAQEIPYTLTCFTSPSGAGVKIIVEVDSEAADHCNAYNQVKTFYEAQLQQTIDRSGKDVSRLCFYSYDPDIFINENHPIFEIDKEYNGKEVLFQNPILPHTTAQKVLSLGEDLGEDLPPRLQVLPSGEDLGGAFLQAMLLTQKKMHFTEGNRNNFVYLFASNCNRLGITEADTQAYSNTEFLELAPSEIRQTVTSAYKHHQSEFGKYQKQNNKNRNFTAYSQHNKPPLGGLEEKLAIGKAFPPGEDLDGASIDQLLLSTPFLPEEIFPLLPDLLREGCEAFILRREKDVFLTGALAILSGCIQNVKGNYGGADTYTNLFAFIVAPAASGKGALLHARTLGKAYHKTLTEQSISSKRNYDADFAAYKEELSKAIKNGATTPEEPVEPPFKMLYIPGNSSAAMVMKHLQDSAGFGIMCETEADTIGQVLKQDWGGFSDILRKAFHFEPISISRKGNKEYIDIEHPRLSVAISGTPDQVTKLIPTAENGLFSRFLFYVFSTEVEWLRNARKFQPINKTEHFNNLSQQVSEMIAFLETYPTDFDFTDEQWDTFDEYFNDTIRKKYCFLGAEVLSCIKRAALIQFRLAMIITALRKFEDYKNHGLLPNTDKGFHYCTTQDFDISHKLINTYIEHAIFILEKLPKSESGLLLNKSNPKFAFFKNLPQEFEFSTAVEHGEAFKISPRTVRNYINSLVENNLLVKTQYGHYTKTAEKEKSI